MMQQTAEALPSLCILLQYSFELQCRIGVSRTGGQAAFKATRAPLSLHL